MKRITLFVVLLLLFVMSMGVQAQSARSYIILANGTTLPADLAAQVSAAGGTLDAVYGEIGVAIASASTPNFARRITGVRSVTEDIGFTMQAPVAQFAYVAETTTSRGNRGNGNGRNTTETTTTSSVVVEATGYPPTSGDDDRYFDLQWGHNAVNAQEAWAAGVRGAGARVAVLDTGFDLDHPDLAPNINLALSRDFTGEGLQYTLPDTFSHGTHTAGTVAAADNGIGTIGVAPEAELVLVKVLGDDGNGDFGDIIAGIYYAAIVDADVISMSLGTIIPQNLRDEDGNSLASAVAELRVATSQAVTFAYQSGSIVIVSAGNAGADLNGDGSAVRFMTGMPHTFGVSALGPVGWAVDPTTDLNVVTDYTNYGTSMVEFSAPGGNYVYPGNENCTVGGITRPCFVFDYVFSTGNNGYYWSVGTSMAAPHAAGIAALIISANGGEMSPAHVAAAMRDYALDLGAAGKDDFFGHGVVQSGY